MARPRLAGLALALATLLIYLPVSRHGFVLYDDPDYLTENRTVQAGLTGAGLEWSFTTWHASNWHPLTWLSHMLDCELFGLDAGAHHLVSTALHAASAALLLTVLGRMTGAWWPSALVAALFAWHPLRVESVAWAAERKDVLGGLFWMLTLLMYAKYVQAQEPGGQRAEDRGPRTRAVPPISRFTFHVSRYYALALVCFALGLMSKPMLVTLPFVLLLLDYWPLGRFELKTQNSKLKTLLPLFLEKVPFLCLSVAASIVTILAQRQEAIAALEPYPLELRLGNALLSYTRYLWKTIWPVHLSVVYPLPHTISWAPVTAACAILAILSWIAWQGRQPRPHLLVGWLWFLGTLVPVIGLVQVGGQAMADRYTYLPSIGLFTAVVFEARASALTRKLGSVAPGVVAGIALAACILVTESQLRYWRSSESLFSRALAVTKDNAIAHINLGVAYEQQGRREAAMREYQEALNIDPRLAQVHNNLGNLLEASGNSDEALAQYREGLRLMPRAFLAHLNLGTLLVKLRQFDEAMAHYQQAAQLRPEDPRPHYLMGKSLLRQGRDLEAPAQLRAALRLDANDVPTLICLARMLASDENPLLRNAGEAVTLAERANARTGGEQPFVLDTLAMAYAEAGRFDDARQTLRRALDRASSGAEPEAVAALQQRLRLYESNRPYHGPLVDAGTNSTFL